MSVAIKFVADAAALAPVVVYEPEDIELGRYTFVPWVRTGLAAEISGAPVGIRAGVAPSVRVEDASGSETVAPSKPIALLGPGDVIGLDPGQIIRRYPTPGAFSVDPSYLVHVEFDRPEFPWLFTPFVPAGDRLDPWLALIAIPTDGSPQPAGSESLPPFVDVAKKHLQPLTDRWAWAHAQAAGPPKTGASVADRLTNAYAATNLSRVLCPRKLEGERAYLACLVPAYDCGVNAALGRPGGELKPAWTRSAGDDNDVIRLPVYAYWQFTTGPVEANFEALSKKIKGVVAPWRIGRRIIDMSQPRGDLELADAQGRRQLFECALTAPQPVPQSVAQTLGQWSAATRDRLRQQLNVGTPANPAAPPPLLPHVNPRIYAQYQRGARTVAAVGDTDWFEQINTSPVDRVAAGLGTRVVQKDQEPLMQAAWAQVGAVDAANNALVRAQFARYAAAALHRNHFGRLDLGGVSQVTRAVHGKIRLGGSAFTIAGTAVRSATPPAALSGAFRKLTRVRGPIARIASRSRPPALVETGLRTLIAVESTFRDFQRPYVEPEGIGGLTQESIERFPKEHIGRLVGSTPELAVDAFRQAIAPLASGLTSADLVQRPVEQWKLRSGEIDLGALGAARAFDRVEAALPGRFGVDLARSEALAKLMVGVGAARLGDVSTRANSVARRIAPRLGPVAEPGLWAGGSLPDVAVTGPDAGILRRRVEGAAAELPSARERLNVGSAVVVATDLGAVRSLAISAVARSFHDALRPISVAALPKTPVLPLLSLARSSVLVALQPAVTVTKYVRGRLGKLPSWLPSDWFDDGRVQPIMAAPKFVRPMYEALDAYDRGWLIPGIGEIPERDFVTLLQTNARFTEAFLIGLSDEMGRELLWRGYPTDARGTYFRRFWDPNLEELASEIHRFTPTALSTHIAGIGGNTGGIAVITIRADLIKHYPDAIVLALRAIGKRPDGGPTFAVPPTPYSNEAGSVVFHAMLPPDIVIVGLRLSIDDLRQPATPWWVVLAEHPTEPRFGLDLKAGEQTSNAALPASAKRNDLTWESLPRHFETFLAAQLPGPIVQEPDGPETTPWGAASTSGAGVARVLLQNPFRAAWHASKLLAQV